MPTERLVPRFPPDPLYGTRFAWGHNSVGVQMKSETDPQPNTVNHPPDAVNEPHARARLASRANTLRIAAADLTREADRVRNAYLVLDDLIRWLPPEFYATEAAVRLADYFEAT